MLKTAMIIALTATFLSPAFARAAGGGGEGGRNYETDPRFAPSYPKGPAPRYSGGSPIEIKHGALGNNGTFGNPNPAYEEKGRTSLTAPGLLSSPYAYAEKEQFVAAVENRLEFFRAALVELRESSQITRPEAVAWSKEAMPRLQNLVDEAGKALKQAKRAGSKDWPSAEQEARAALSALMGTYDAFTSSAAHGLTDVQ